MKCFRRSELPFREILGKKRLHLLLSYLRLLQLEHNHLMLFNYLIHSVSTYVALAFTDAHAHTSHVSGHYLCGRFLTKRRHKSNLVPWMRSLTLVCLLLALTQWFFDLLMISSFGTAQTSFQRLWLCFHLVILTIEQAVLLYGFSVTVIQTTYHGISNYRSWLLFTGTSLLFSGLFVVVGYCTDGHLFRRSCRRGFHIKSLSHQKDSDRKRFIDLRICMQVRTYA